LAKIQQVLLETNQLESLTNLSGVEELSGFSGFYRIKFDYRYRIGIYYENGVIQFLRVGGRESFYKKFP
jgi:mRNA-degrading endonuclease RelE of RelBE toxin-antitoxin system